jgi:hypothetical protein
MHSKSYFEGVWIACSKVSCLAFEQSLDSLSNSAINRLRSEWEICQSDWHVLEDVRVSNNSRSYITDFFILLSLKIVRISVSHYQWNWCQWDFLLWDLLRLHSAEHRPPSATADRAGLASSLAHSNQVGLMA